MSRSREHWNRVKIQNETSVENSRTKPTSLGELRSLGHFAFGHGRRESRVEIVIFFFSCLRVNIFDEFFSSPEAVETHVRKHDALCLTRSETLVFYTVDTYYRIIDARKNFKLLLCLIHFLFHSRATTWLSVATQSVTSHVVITPLHTLLIIDMHTTVFKLFGNSSYREPHRWRVKPSRAAHITF